MIKNTEQHCLPILPPLVKAGMISSMQVEFDLLENLAIGMQKGLTLYIQ